MPYIRFFPLLSMCFIPIALHAQTAIIADHTCTDLAKVPASYIAQAKQQFRISYGHTSHGSQIVTGMELLRGMPGSIYTYSNDGSGGSLSLHDRAPGGDLGGDGDLTWARATRTLLQQPNCNRNMIMWSWCGGCSGNTEAGIDAYLHAMDSLERDYPAVTFVYMTGHLDGTGVEGNLHKRNEQIRRWCREQGKVLFDFADIERYDPDGKSFLELFADDNCDYTTGGGQKGNWAREWCARNPGSCSECSCAHSQCLNCQQKGKVFWWMMARLAGWDGVTSSDFPSATPAAPGFLENHPNPFTDATTLRWMLPGQMRITLRIRDLMGRCVSTLIEGETRPAGSGEAVFSAGHLPQGLYFGELLTEGRRSLRPLLILR